MADAILSAIFQQITTIGYQQVEHEVKLVVGVEKEIENLKSNLQAIHAVLEDAERKQLNNGEVKQWLNKLKDASYDMDDVLDEWRTAILKREMEKAENALAPKSPVCSFLSSLCLRFPRVARRRDIAHKIKEVGQRLQVIADEQAKYGFKLHEATEEIERLRTTSFVDVSKVQGREAEKKKLISMLLSGSSQEARQVHVISIEGMGGIGKTTLAQLAYNADEIRLHFEKRTWVCVSHPFEVSRVAKAIIEDLSGATPNLAELQPLCQRISESIEGKKYLLVLDDVWDDNAAKWEPLKESLKSGAPGSRILVTTRKKTVAKMMESHSLTLGKLSDEECWLVFSQIAFHNRRQEEYAKFEETGRQIVSKCNGLPLAAKTLGGLMQSKTATEEWDNVLSNELWQIEEVEKGIFPPLLLSYYDLPVAIRCCFTYCAMFPKDHVMERGKLVKMWMAQGYLKESAGKEMELVGKDYFEILATRAFFQDFQETEEESVRFKMHDIVHDFAQFLMKDECFTVETDVLKKQQTDLLYKTARHAIMTVSNWAQFPESIYSARKLRSLLIRSFNEIEISKPLLELLHNLTYLRLFDLSSSPIEEVPGDVGKLVHLRYLNFSHCEWLKELPETLSDLYNLQTLDLTLCASVTKLPQKMRKLTSLRHLDIFGSGVAFMPKGIEKLTSLRTLTNFIVCGGGDESVAANLGELQNLNHLKGTLWIEKLRNAGDVSEAAKAEIKKKKYLIGLYLLFDGDETESQADENALIGALEPPQDLQVLTISEYRGDLLPNWIMSLTKLKRLDVSHCGSFDILPPFGRLPYLEKLKIGVKTRKLDVGFLGIETVDSGNEEGGTAAFTAFPKLKQLYIWKMEELEEWDGIGRSLEENETTTTIMPQLRELEVKGCPKLRALPDYILTAALVELRINECPILKERYKAENGEDWHKISYISVVEIDYQRT